MRRIQTVFILAVGAVLFATAWPVSAPAEGEYELEYSVVNNGGGQGASADYNVVDSVKVSGLDESFQSSSSYSVESALAEPDPPTSVVMWYLF